ncbi:class I histocompatibility antigen, F10 alpha chain-like isoform X5 [Hemiscyllium ocellatum]|uniref:class I histocompatibility antigen, F10 alpha chain-like isoform X5 n=1 Tax=Hemiscyllium ocellatum TaxID=170820 RepID=UPI002966B625|nr:class I histocompatibility antigen, F10 alpha chain-like isoform X5 [Hemiscyllium ocellatum]
MLLILLSISLCFSRVSPETNSPTLKYTIVSGAQDFPEVTVVAMVNGIQTGYFDSDTHRCVPRQQFLTESLSLKFWDDATDQAITHTGLAKENLKSIMKRTNQTSVQPEVFISRREPNGQDKPLTLSCLVTGFYPVDIEVTWLRNGEVMSETQSSGVRPNHDGTQQIQKEIEINAGDEDQYSCQIEHSSLAEAQLYQWEIPENSVVRYHFILLFGLIAAMAAIFRIIIWKRPWRGSPSGTYTTAPS